MDREKKCGVWVITVRDKPPAECQGNTDPTVEEIMKRDGLRKPKRKQRPARYIK